MILFKTKNQFLKKKRTEIICFRTFETLEQEHKLIAFYTKETQNEAFVIEANEDPALKAPKFADNSPNRKNYTNGNFVVQKIKFGELRPMLDYRHIVGERTIVVDFDYHKIKDKQIRNRIDEKLKSLIVKNDWTAVTTPRGGLHLYFKVQASSPLRLKILKDLTARCLIPNIDWLGGAQKILGPDGQARKILNVTKGDSLPILPTYLHPVSLTMKGNTAFLSSLDFDPTACWFEGKRAKGMLALIRACRLSNNELREFNDLFCNPPKDEDDMQMSVFARRSETEIRNINEFQDPLAVGVCFDVETASVFVYDEEVSPYWIKTGLFEAAQKLVRQGIPLRGTPLDNHIFRQLAVRDMNKSRRSWECNLTGHPIYYKNDAILLVKNSMGKFEIQRLSPDLLHANLVNAATAVEYDLTAAKEEEILSILSKELSLYEKLQTACPILFNFLSTRMVFQSKNLMRVCTEALMALMAVVFLKQSKDYDFTLSLQKVAIVTGTGKNGKGLFSKLLEAFTAKTLLAFSDLHRLHDGKFEASRFINAVCTIFPDQDNPKKGTFFHGIIKAISGGDTFPTEKKYAALTEHVSATLNIFFTNLHSSMANLSAQQYGAVKRRAAIFPFNIKVPMASVIKNLDQDILAADGAAAMLIFASEAANREIILENFRKYDFESLVYKHQEIRAYNAYTCAYFGFVHDVLTPRKNAIKVDITITELFGYYLQYAKLRPGSLSQRYINQFKVYINECFECHDPRYDYLKRMLKSECPPDTQQSSSTASWEETFHKLISSRGEYIEGFEDFYPELEIIKEQFRDLKTGQYKEGVLAHVCMVSIHLNVDFLNSMPHFIVSKRVKTALQGFENKYKVLTIGFSPEAENEGLGLCEEVMFKIQDSDVDFVKKAEILAEVPHIPNDLLPVSEEISTKSPPVRKIRGQQPFRDIGPSLKEGVLGEKLVPEEARAIRANYSKEKGLYYTEVLNLTQDQILDFHLIKAGLCWKNVVIKPPDNSS